MELSIPHLEELPSLNLERHLCPDKAQGNDATKAANHPDPASTKPSGAPLVLVCTHGRRDACCARLGIGLYTEVLAAATLQGASDRVWQSSHLGGHRFAPVATTFPDGLSYGRVAPGDGTLIWQAATGTMPAPLATWRGRSIYEPAAQAAEIMLRERGTDPGPLRHIEPVVGHGRAGVITHQTAQPVWQVDFARASLRITTRQSDQVRAKSCGAKAEAVVSYEACR